VLKLVDDLLDLARVAAGRFEIDLQETSLNDVIDDVVVLPNGTTMSDYYVMLRTFNQVCFDLERCTKELAIERKVHISIEDELLEAKKREITLERRLVEEKANSAINKQMLNEVLLSREESPLKHNHSFNKN
jgi:signal transduction histidine kinase